jgi:TonB family protein
MKPRLLLVFALTPLSAALAQQPPKPAPSVGNSLNWIFRIEAEEFISAADAMPEEKWTFIPSSGEFKGVRTFGGQVWHVACANEGFAAELESQKPPEHCEALGPGPDEHPSKDKLMAYLRANFERVQRDIDALTPANMLEEIDTLYPGGRRTRLSIAATAVYHAADHFGQIVEYLRLNGIVPPSSRPRRQSEATPSPVASPSSKFGTTDQQLAEAPAPEAPLPASYSSPKRVTIGGSVAQGNLIHRVDPVYPISAKQRGIQGDVVLEAVIGKDGLLKDLRVISGDPELNPAALAAVSKWRYRPYTLQGKPAEVRTTITVHFQLYR